jgi:hypothetical protein
MWERWQLQDAKQRFSEVVKWTMWRRASIWVGFHARSTGKPQRATPAKRRNQQ